MACSTVTFHTHTHTHTQSASWNPLEKKGDCCNRNPASKPPSPREDIDVGTFDSPGKHSLPERSSQHSSTDLGNIYCLDSTNKDKEINHDTLTFSRIFVGIYSNIHTGQLHPGSCAWIYSLMGRILCLIIELNNKHTSDFFINWQNEFGVMVCQYCLQSRLFKTVFWFTLLIKPKNY